MSKYKLVPVEPTEEMLDAIRFRVGSIDRVEADEIYYLILSASPDVHRHPATPSFLEYPSFEESANFDPVPAVQGEPVAVVDADDDGMWADILPNVTVKVGQSLYTAPQPAEQQLAPDVAGLVEALEGLLGVIGESRGVSGYHLNGEIAEWDEFQEVHDATAALAAHRKGGEA